MRPSVLTFIAAFIYTICASSAYIKDHTHREVFAQRRLLTRAQASTAQIFDEPSAIFKRVESSVVLPDGEPIDTPKDAYLSATSQDGRGRRLGPNQCQLYGLYKERYKNIIIEKVSLEKNPNETVTVEEKKMKLKKYIKQLKEVGRYVGETRTGASSLVYIASLPPPPDSTAPFNPLLSNQEILDLPSTHFALTGASH